MRGAKLARARKRGGRMGAWAMGEGDEEEDESNRVCFRLLLQACHVLTPPPLLSLPVPLAHPSVFCSVLASSPGRL
eukprot:813346-Pyramimonas_sp.AAC.1